MLPSTYMWDHVTNKCRSIPGTLSVCICEISGGESSLLKLGHFNVYVSLPYGKAETDSRPWRVPRLQINNCYRYDYGIFAYYAKTKMEPRQKACWKGIPSSRCPFSSSMSVVLGGTVKYIDYRYVFIFLFFKIASNNHQRHATTLRLRTPKSNL